MIKPQPLHLTHYTLTPSTYPSCLLPPPCPSGAGDISISDIDLAAASGAMVVGFNLSPEVAVEEHAKRQGVKVMTYKVSGRGVQGV